MPRLLVIKGADEGKQFDLTEPVVSLGRDASNHIRLHDTEVSRRHAEVRQTDAGFQLVDHASANGTFVNRSRIHPGQKRQLFLNDVIQIGTVHLKVKVA